MPNEIMEYLSFHTAPTGRPGKLKAMGIPYSKNIYICICRELQGDWGHGTFVNSNYELRQSALKLCACSAGMEKGIETKRNGLDRIGVRVGHKVGFPWVTQPGDRGLLLWLLTVKRAQRVKYL